MTITGQIDGKQFNGYLRLRIPHELDQVVAKVVSTYRSASAETRRTMVGEIGARAAGVLSAYGERMAVMAVRQNSPALLSAAVVAMGMAEERLDDARNNLIVLAAVNHSAEISGRPLSAILDDVADELSERVLVQFRAFVNRAERDKSLPAMGLRAIGVGNSFRYVSGPTS